MTASLADELDEMKLVTGTASPPSRERITQYLQYPVGDGRNRLLDERISEGMAELLSLAVPRGGYVLKKRQPGLTETAHLPAPAAGAEFVVFCLATIGDALETRIDELVRSGDSLRAMILDSLGSAAVSEWTEALAEVIRGKAQAAGLKATRAFSPGAGSSHWPLENQRYVFKNIDADGIGVQLSRTYTMSPRKSLSFIIGLGGSVVHAAHAFSCTGCVRTDCTYRFIPRQSAGAPSC
ncbi:MAG: hypothetical protein HQ559_06490 [Lentisphaerae bacterium]|nr:hypothetical protein [Lentisphaerota bacterium]